MAEGTPTIVRACIFARALCLPGSCVVFILYWGLVFDGTLHLISVFTHGVNFVVMVLDTLINRQPLRMAHWLYFQLYAMLYIVWTIIFHVAGIDRPCDCSEDDDKTEKYGCDEEGDKRNADECHYIYGSVNWASSVRTGTTVLVCLLLFIMIPICYFLFYAIVLFVRKVAKNNENDDEKYLRQTTLDEIKDNECCGTCKYEMKLERLSLQDPNWVYNFKSSSKSGLSDFYFLILRVVIFAFWFAIFIWSLVSQDFLQLWAIYLTNLTLLIQLVYLGLAAAATYKAQRTTLTTGVPPPDDEDKL